MPLLTTKQYIDAIIENNPIEKLLPMTHKNNHGISLDYWQDVFLRHGIETIQKQYLHRVVGGNNYYSITLEAAKKLKP